MANRTWAAVLHYLRILTAAQADRDLSDAELLERFRGRREETAFALLLQRHGPMVLGVCGRILGNLHDAEDAFQATFLVLARNAPAVRQSQSLASWLYGVAQRVATKARKQAASRRRREQQVAAMAPTEAIDEPTWQELRPILDEELAALPERYRAPLVLRYLQDKTCEQVAQELGVARATVSGRLKRGLQLLRHRFAERGLELTAALLAVVLGQKATATVPALLTLTTVRSATLLVSGPAPATGLVSARALGLAQGVTMSPTLNKAKIAALLLLLAGALTATAVALLQRSADPSAREAWPLAEPPAGAADPQDALNPPLVLSAREATAWPMKKQPAFLALTPARNTLTAVSPSGEITSWNLATGQPGEPRQLPGGKVIGLSPDGSVAATATGNDVTLVEATTGRTMAGLRTAGVPPPEANPVAKYGVTQPEVFHPDRAFIAPDNRTVAVRCGCNLEVWALAGGRPQRLATPQQEGPFKAAAFSPDASRLAYLGWNLDEGLSVWDLSARKRTVHVPPPINMGDPRRPNTPASVVSMETVTFTPDGKTVVVGGDCHYHWTDELGQDQTARVCWLRAWDAATGAERYTREYRVPDTREDDARIDSLAVSRAGVLAAGARVGPVQLFDAATGRPLGKVDGSGGVPAVFLTADARTLIVAGRSVKVYELAKEPAGAPEPFDTWKPPAPSPAAEAYQTLIREHQTLVESVENLEKEYRSLKTDEDRRRFLDRARDLEAVRLLGVFPRRFLDLAGKHPEDPVASEALWQALLLSGHGPEADEAAARLAARLQAGDKSAAALFVQLGTTAEPRPFRTLLRAFVEHGPTPEIRAQASFKLAKSLLALADVAQQLQADTTGKVAREWGGESPQGAERVKQFRGEDPKALTAEAEQILHLIVEKQANIPHPYHRTTLGEAAQWELAELRNPRLAIGKTAPEVEGKDAEGKSFKLSDYRGKVVVLTFSANWCGPCRAMYAQERQLVERLKDRPFALLSVNADDHRDTLGESVNKGEITWRCWWDGREGPLVSQWHIEAYPTVFVLDGKGVIRFKDVRGEALDAAVSALLQEAQPAR
jgi:RNA polymerase sigma factor (sigma-70 family)